MHHQLRPSHTVHTEEALKGEKKELYDLHHHRLVPELLNTSFLGSEPNPWPRAAAEGSQCDRFPKCYWERPREERMACRAHRVICRAAYLATVADDGAEALACLASVKIKRAKSDNLLQGQLEDVLHEDLGCCPPPPPHSIGACVYTVGIGLTCQGEHPHITLTVAIGRFGVLPRSRGW